MNTYRVIAESEKRTTVYFTTKFFKTISELNEYFEDFEMCHTGIYLNIYRDDALLVGYMQATVGGLMAVRRNATGDEVLLED